jgi:hypothetical protein
MLLCTSLWRFSTPPHCLICSSDKQQWEEPPKCLISLWTSIGSPRRGLTEPPYQYPADQVPPHTGLSPRQGRCTATCPTSLDPTTLLGRAPTLPRVTWLWIPPPCSRGLRCCHESCGSGSCLPTREGSGAAMCPAAIDPATLLRRAPVLP